MLFLHVIGEHIKNVSSLLIIKVYIFVDNKLISEFRQRVMIHSGAHGVNRLVGSSRERGGHHVQLKIDLFDIEYN